MPIQPLKPLDFTPEKTNVDTTSVITIVRNIPRNFILQILLL